MLRLKRSGPGFIVALCELGESPCLIFTWIDPAFIKMKKLLLLLINQNCINSCYLATLKASASGVTYILNPFSRVFCMRMLSYFVNSWHFFDNFGLFINAHQCRKLALAFLVINNLFEKVAPTILLDI